MEDNIERIRDFLAGGGDTLYTILNVTRKEVGLATRFDEEDWASLDTAESELTSVFVPRCPGMGVRECKVTKAEKGATIAPGLVTYMDIADGIMRLRQLRYRGSRKNDLIIVFKSGHKGVGVYLNQNCK